LFRVVRGFRVRVIIFVRVVRGLGLGLSLLLERGLGLGLSLLLERGLGG
jgi:hypothetical protein